MITPAFGLTATERVLPRLALDFTTASLDPRITFTRTTGVSNPATYIDSSGVLTFATNNQPRFDYDPVTLACKGLLIEESRINYITYTSDLSQAAWIKLNLTFDANAGTSPSGANDAFKLKKDATTSTCNVRQVGVASATGTYTASTFAKKGEWNFLYMSVTGSSSNGVAFDLTTGAATPFGTGATGSAVSVGNGWWRCSVTHTLAAQDALNTNQPRPTSSGSNALGNGSDGVYIWGAQLEAGAFATSYIPTTSAALTRNADVAVMTGTNFSDWFNASEGTFETQSQLYSASGTRGYLSANDGTANNVIQMYANGTSGNYEVVTGGVTQASQGAASTINANLLSRCVAYKLNNCGQAINGSFYGVDTTCAIPTVDRLQIGGINAGTSFRFSGWLAKISYWPQRLSSAEIAAFSKG